MRTQPSILTSRLAASLLAGLLAFTVSPAALALDEVPVPHGAVQIAFGMAGLAHLQTARLNVVAIGGGSPNPSDLPICLVEVGFVDDMGEVFHDASGLPIAARFDLVPGEARELDLRAADAFRGSTGLRKAFRAVVRGTAVPPNPCRPPVATLEVFDNLTGRTMLLYAPMGPAS